MKQRVIVMVAALLLVASAAMAQIPRPNVFDGGNRWNITFYNDPSTIHQQWATQIICYLPYRIVGTSIQGVWYSLSFPDWNGLYYQEGDEVKMTGDYAGDVGHDHMTLFHTTVDVGNGIMFKDWTEWREDRRFGFIIGWGNTRMQRQGYCPIPHPGVVIQPRYLTDIERQQFEAEALRQSEELPPRLTAEGEVAD